MNILIISDIAKTISNLKSELEYNHKISVTTYDKAIGFISERFIEIIIVDSSMEEFPSLIRKLKKDPASVKIPLLAYANLANAGFLDFSLNFDDFIIAPINSKELDLRIKQTAFKANKLKDSQVKVGDLVIDFKTYEVTLQGKILDLTFKEYELLKLLVSNRGQVFSRQSLLNQVWGYDYYGGTRTVDTHIARLRSKLGLKHSKLVETVQSVGYRFKK